VTDVVILRGLGATQDPVDVVHALDARLAAVRQVRGHPHGEAHGGELPHPADQHRGQRSTFPTDRDAVGAQEPEGLADHPSIGAICRAVIPSAFMPYAAAKARLRKALVSVATGDTQGALVRREFDGG
jgi:hypothetical protein